MWKHKFLLCMLDPNEMCFLLMLRCRQQRLGSLCFGCIHLLSSWSWSAILFVPDPLPASTIQTHEGETLTRRIRRKPAHLGMTKTFKAFSRQPDPFGDSAYSADEQHMEKDILSFSAACVICVSLDLEVRVAPAKMKWEPAAAARRRVSIEILPPLIRSRGKTNFLKGERK